MATPDLQHKIAYKGVVGIIVGRLRYQDGVDALEHDDCATVSSTAMAR